MAIDLNRIIQAAAEAALEGKDSGPRGQSEQMKRKGLTGPRALLLGAGMYTVGRLVVRARTGGLAEGLQQRLAEYESRLGGDEPSDEDDEDVEEDTEARPEGEGEGDFEDEDFDEPPEDEYDEDEYDEEPEAEEDEEPEAEGDFEDEEPDDEFEDEEPDDEEESEPPRRASSAAGRHNGRH